MAPSPLATAFVRIRPYMKDFGKELGAGIEEGSAGAEAAGASAGEKYLAGMKTKTVKLANTITLGIAAAGAGIAVAGVDMATKFNSDMELLATQAGVAQPKIAALSAGVLKLAGQVGFSPDSLAESLFHVESNFSSLGITGPKALSLVKIAAEGAATGHADLVDVTNALTAAVASGIPGVQNFSKAMGVLNSTVGAGDMKMEDLASALGTGVLASVKGFGLSITDVGAALDVFGDNNIRGAKAGTELRMAVQALAAPTKQGAETLMAMGISSGSLADAMQKGGLKLAIETLVDRMKKMGITADQQGQVLTNVFGKKAGVGIQILSGQFDRFLSKYPALDKGATGFGKAWQATQQTTAQRLKDLQSGFEALEIKIGEKLLPVVIKLFDWMQGHMRIVTILAASIGSLAVAITVVTKTAAAIKAVGEAFAAVKDSAIAAAIATRVAAVAGALYDGVLKVTALSVVAFQDSVVAAKIAVIGAAIANKAMAAGTVIWTAITYAVNLAKDSMIAMKVATIAQAVATRIAAAAQFLFDAAMDANPIGLIIIAVAGLVVGIYELVKHVTIVRVVFEDVWNWIRDHWKLLLPILLGPIGLVVDLIVSKWHLITDAVGDVISWIAGHWKELLAILLGPIGIAIDIIVTQWHHIVNAVGDVISWIGEHWKLVLEIITGPVGLAVVFVINHWNQVKQAFSDLWQWIWADFGAKILGFFAHTLPGWLGNAVAWIQRNFVVKFEEQFAVLYRYIWTDFGAKIMNFWLHTVPGWLGTAVQWVETNFVDRWIAQFDQLYQYIWTDFGAKIFAFLVHTLPQWFTDAVNGIKTAWNDIENAVKVPVNWVIQYVYDDGIRKVWNFVANLAGLPDLPVIATLASGGKVPGFGGGDKYPALLEGGEAVVDKHRTAMLAPLFGAIGVPGFAQGGLVGDKGNTGTSQANHAASVMSGIGDTFKIMAALVSGNKVALENALDSLIPQGAGGAKSGSGIAQLVTALPVTILTDLAEKAIKAFAESGGAIIAYAESFIGKVPYKWGGTTTAGWDCSGFTQFVYDKFGYDPPRVASAQQAWAQPVGSPVPGGLAFFAGADGTAQSAGHVGIVIGPNQMVDAFGTGFGTRLNTIYGSSGAVGGFGIPPGGFGNRPGAVHTGHFDQGGWLQPGLTLALNGTGRPERILGPGETGGAGAADICDRLDDLIAILSAAPGQTAGALGSVLSGAGRRAGYRAMYAAGG